MGPAPVMSSRGAGGPASRWASGFKPVLVFIAALTVARLVYLAAFCPYTLIEDEAHYWEWSRHLALSYYSKGPGVAWVIAASTALLGDTELGVRFLAPVFSGLASLALAGLALSMHRDRRAGFFAAACFQLAPAHQFTSLILTIDMPYVACWSAAALAAWHAVERRRGPAWMALGLALGLGVLFKYTTLLLVPGIAGYALWRARQRRAAPGEAVRTGSPPRTGLFMLAGLAAFAAALTPILAWNIQHGWPTFKHLLGHLGVAGGDMPVAARPADRPHYTPAWTLEFIGAQFGLIGPVLLLMMPAAWRAVRGSSPEGASPEAGSRRGDVFAVLCAAPIVLFYLIVSFLTEGEGNWAIAAYATLSIPAARLALAGLDRYRSAATGEATEKAGPEANAPRAKRRSWARALWRISVVYGVLCGVGMLRIDALKAIPGLGPRVPTGRLMHADDRAREFLHLAQELEARTDQTPFYMAQHYGRASQMAFYLPGHPTVYCTSRLMGGRATQYDMWAHTDLTNPQTHARLAGRPAVMNGGEPYHWEVCFDRVEPLGPLPSESKRGRMTYAGFGYRGFAPAASGPSAPTN